MAAKSFIAVGCTHRPLHDQSYCDWVIDKIVEYQPDVFLHLGDLFDAKTISRFKSFGGPTLNQEYESTDVFLERVNDALPKDSDRWYLMGNHENRIWSEDNAAVADLIEPTKHLTQIAGWTILPYVNSPRCVARIGQVSFSHGFQFSARSKIDETINFGVPNGLHIRSHTHQGYGPTQLMWGQKLPIPYWHANTGCGIKSDEGYFQTINTRAWNRGLIHGHADDKLHADDKSHWHAEFIYHSNLWHDK